MSGRRGRRSGGRLLRSVLYILLLVAGGYALVASGVMEAALPERPAGKPPVEVKPKPPPLPSAALIDVPAQSQLPALPNGCEVTSLSMLLTAVGHPVSYLTLAKDQPYDPTKRVLQDGKVVFWGNPNVGFVGSVYQAGLGYGIYHGPMTKFLNSILPGRAVDLTGKPFKDIERVVADGTPVEMWTTTTLGPTTEWGSWQSPEGLVRFTPQEHAVLLVGYNRTDVFVNNPLNGEKAQATPIGPFLQSWNQLGDQAISVLPVKKKG